MYDVNRCIQDGYMVPEIATGFALAMTRFFDTLKKPGPCGPGFRLSRNPKPPL